MGKEKKAINILTVFSFPIKVMSKLSLTRFLTSALRTLGTIFLYFNLKVPIKLECWT